MARKKIAPPDPCYTKKILSKLKKEFPSAHCELHHNGPFQLLIATILSAQCTDVQVNKVTPKLFQKYPSPEILAKTPLEEIEQSIKSIGLYKNKAKNIKKCAEQLVTQFSGSVPQTMKELIHLAGVGRKTANVVLSNAFNINAGVVVDTHVKRISGLLHLTTENTPEKIEKDLMQLFPQKNWGELSHLLIFLGRRTCTAKKVNCHECCLQSLCPSAFTFEK